MAKVILVTGASRGIGLAIAHRLLSNQHKVFMVARTAEPMDALKTRYPDSADYATVDITDLSVLDETVLKAVRKFGRLDGVVINHGVLSPMSRIADAPIEQWKALYDVNLFSVLGLAKAAIPHLRQTNGRIVVTSSGAALKGYTSWGAYGSSKAAVNSLVQHLAVEEPLIVSVAVSPGRVDTDMQKEIRETGANVMTPTDYSSFVSAFEDGTLNPPEKPAAVIAKLAVDAALDLSGKYVNWNAPEMAVYNWPN